MNRAAFNPPTAIAAALLLAAAAGLYGYAFAAGHHLVKPATPIAEHLYKFPDKLGAYALDSKVTLAKETAHELNAREHFNRVYIRTAPPQTLTFHVSYHTGRPDARPYVSPRCYVAGGVESDDFESRTLAIKTPGGAVVEIPVRTFRMPTEGDAPASEAMIVYTHIVGDSWIADPVAVSEAVYDPTTPAAWWTRVELLIPKAENADAAAAIATDFLAAAVPPIMKHLPQAPPLGN